MTSTVSDELQLIFQHRSFEGEIKSYNHRSRILERTVNLDIFLPPKVERENVRCPVVFFLLGMSLDETEFSLKSGFQKYAAKYNLIFVMPTAWPEKPKKNDDQTKYWAEFGLYVDATEGEYVERKFLMSSYIINELVPLIDANFLTIPGARGIMGHSMGGHAALVFGLKHPSIFKSISAMAPTCNPTADDSEISNSFKLLLGDDKEKLKKWDACELVARYDGPLRNIFINVGGNDEYGELLRISLFIEKCYRKNVTPSFEFHPDYEHSYGFVQTFIKDHIKFHRKELSKFAEKIDS